MLPALREIESAAAIVRELVPPTPQICWPLLCERLGTEIWVKHENHTPIGAFKLRGGLVYFENLSRHGKPPGVISATRGNHGQSVACAARRYGIPATIVVPYGNSREKNAAMRAHGAELIEHGTDFQEAREFAEARARERNLHMIPAYDRLLIMGVATGSLELLRSVQDIDTVYVPIGIGSGICAMIACRDALRLPTRIVGVVSTGAPAYARSFAAGKPVQHEVTTKLADGLAVRTPDPDAVRIIREGVDRIVEVSDEELAASMRLIFECTHNVAEGAGAAGIAAAIREKSRIAGRRVAVILTGGNVDREVFAAALGAAC